MTPARADLVVVGVGQLGGLYATGALRGGFRVTPVGRDVDPGAVVDAGGAGPVLVTVGEDTLAAVLRALPSSRRDDAILVQNELFPADLDGAPTLAVVWLNRKEERPAEVARPTVVHGRHAGVMARIHAALRLPCRVVTEPAALHAELVAKYAFIVCVNGLGVLAPLTVGEWLARDPGQVRRLLQEGVAVGEARLGQAVDRAAAIAAGEEALRALVHMPVRGRTARARIERAVAAARARGVAVPALDAIVAAA